MEERQINQELNKGPEWIIILRRLYEDMLKEKQRGGHNAETTS